MSNLRESTPCSLEFDQQTWDRAVEAIARDVHPVDREATQIWFHFWPLKLAGLARSEGLDEVARRYKLGGRFRLSEQLDESVELFYGSRFWPEVKTAVSTRAQRPEPRPARSPEPLIREVADEVAAAAGVSSAIVLGVAAAATMALQQLGEAGLRRSGAAGTFRRREIGPEAVLRDRRGKRRRGLRKLLGHPKHTITWDERRGRTFVALDGQNMTMAAAEDLEDHRAMDPRRVAGPIPVECRSGACGSCWIGVIAGGDNLSEVTPFERERLRLFGYADYRGDETHAPVRLACQCAVSGEAVVVIPPWNGVLGGRT